MRSHYAIGIKLQTFVLNAMLKAFKKYFFILIADKQVYPVYNSKAYKTEFIVFLEFVFMAHGNKIQISNEL